MGLDGQDERPQGAEGERSDANSATERSEKSHSSRVEEKCEDAYAEVDDILWMYVGCVCVGCPPRGRYKEDKELPDARVHLELVAC